MSYRVEAASTGRAVCRATECKKNGIKIDKNELRMGTWVEFEHGASWTWKHWGCVTGAQLQNMRNNLEDPENPGVYRWDFLDGYEGDEKNSLDKYPDLQEKVRRVITQGFIDPEDFNGDPEMNKLGEKGLFTTESKRKKRQDQVDRNREIEELQAQDAAKLETVNDNPGGAKKKTKATTANDGSEEESGGKKTTKRKRSSKAIKEEDDDEVYDVRPTKKSRAKKAKKEEESEMIKEEIDDAPPAILPQKKRAGRGKKAVKKEAPDDQDSEAGPSEVKPKDATKKSKGKNAVKEEIVDEQNDIDQVAEYQETSSKSQRKKRGRRAIKQESSGASSSTFKADPSGSIDASSEALSAGPSESYIPGLKDADLHNDFDRAVDAGEVEGDFEAYIEIRKTELATPQQNKGRRGKRSAAPKAASSRPSRNSTK